MAIKFQIFIIFKNQPTNVSYGNHACVINILCSVVHGYYIYKDIWLSAHGEASVRLVMICISICMLFLLCNTRRPFLSRAFMILRSSALAVDEDGIENDGVSFRLGT